jgi:hypothetical protein
MNGKESANEKEKASSSTAPLLKIFEDMLHNRILQKKHEIHKITQSIADTERLWTEIQTLRWVLAQRLSIK